MLLPPSVSIRVHLRLIPHLTMSRSGGCGSASQGGGQGADDPANPGDERDPGALEDVARLVGQAECPPAVEGDLDGLPSARGVARLAEGGLDVPIMFALSLE